MNLAYNTYEPPGSNENLNPIIFLHGAGDSKETWGDIPRRIADKTKRKVYAFDSGNHGDSGWREVSSFNLNVDDLIHSLDALSIEKCVLVGHSMGGTTSIRTALEFPERVEMIFVEDIYVQRVGQKTYNSVIRYFQLCLEAAERIPIDCKEDEVHRHIADYLFEKRSELKSIRSRKHLDKIFFATKRSDSGRYTFKANLEVMIEAMKDSESMISEPHGLYEGPATFIYGQHSTFKVGERKEHIRQFFPNAEFYPVAGADHYIHPYFPEEFTDIILQGLSKEQISSDV